MRAQRGNLRPSAIRHSPNDGPRRILTSTPATKRRSPALLALGIALILFAAAILGALAFLTLQPAEEREAIAVPEQTSRNEPVFPQVNWKKLQKLSPDIVGWVHIPGTDISQPIVQAHADNADFYLSHNLKGDYSVYGCPYLAPENEEQGLQSEHCLIYGHHLDIGGAFSDLVSYQDESWAKDHQEIWLLTPQKNRCLTVICVQRVEASTYSPRTKFPTQDSYATWLLREYEEADLQLAVPQEERVSYSFVTCDAGYSTNWRIIITAQEKG